MITISYCETLISELLVVYPFLYLPIKIIFNAFTICVISLRVYNCGSVGFLMIIGLTW